MLGPDAYKNTFGMHYKNHTYCPGVRREACAEIQRRLARSDGEHLAATPQSCSARLALLIPL
jgi:hypothetical protein